MDTTLIIIRENSLSASRKIEEARFILEMIPAALSVPNFSACRALYYGFQSSIYSTREALKKSSHRIGHPANKWWKDIKNNIEKNEPFLQFLHIDYNGDKHAEPSGLLIPSLREYGYKGPAPDIFSGEGAFMIENRGTAFERRIFLPHGAAIMSIRLDYTPQTIQGRDVSGLPFEQMLGEVLVYFEGLVTQARMNFE